MLIFDSIFLSASLAYLYFSYLKNHTLAPWFLIATTLLCLLHIWMEGARWQMAPTYIIPLIGWFSLTKRNLIEIPKYEIFGFTLLIFISIYLSWALPVFKIPVPSGPYAVGVTTRHLVDDNRLETLTDAPKDNREVGLRIWYPGELASGKREKYWPNESGRNSSLLSFFKAPEFLGFVFSHISNIDTNSYRDIPPADGPFPVLLFSHARGIGFGSQNTILMEHLASHGYVIIAIEHLYWGLFYQYPDGRVAVSDRVQRQFADLYEQERTKELDNLPIHNTHGLEEMVVLLERAEEILPLSTALNRSGIEIWSRDQRFVMDQLKYFQDKDPLLAGKLRIDLIGVFGTSFGGTSSLQTCVVDSRCKAVANLDGFQINSIHLPPLQVPLLIISEEKFEWHQIAYENANDSAVLIKIAETEQANFTDFALLSPLLIGTPLLGNIEPQHGLDLINNYVRRFFNSELLGKNKQRIYTTNLTDRTILSKGE